MKKYALFFLYSFSLVNVDNNLIDNITLLIIMEKFEWNFYR